MWVLQNYGWKKFLLYMIGMCSDCYKFGDVSKSWSCTDGSKKVDGGKVCTSCFHKRIASWDKEF